MHRRRGTLLVLIATGLFFALAPLAHAEKDDFYETCSVWARATRGGFNQDRSWKYAAKLLRQLAKVKFDDSKLDRIRREAIDSTKQDLIALFAIGKLNGWKPDNADLVGDAMPLVFKRKPTKEEENKFWGDLVKRLGSELAIAGLKRQHRNRLRELNTQLVRFVIRGRSRFGGKSPEGYYAGLLSQKKGSKIRVVKVFANSPADKAGVKVGMEVVSVNGKKIEKTAQIHPAASNNSKFRADSYVFRDGRREKRVKLIPAVMPNPLPVGLQIRRSWPRVWEHERVKIWNRSDSDLSQAVVLITFYRGKRFNSVVRTVGKWPDDHYLSTGVRRDDSGYIPGYWIGPYEKVRVEIVSPEARFASKFDYTDDDHAAWIREHLKSRKFYMGYLPTKPGVFSPYNRGVTLRFTGGSLPVEQVSVQFRPQKNTRVWRKSYLSSGRKHYFRSSAWKRAPQSIGLVLRFAETDYEHRLKIDTPRARTLDKK